MKTTSKTVTAYDAQGNASRITLPPAVWTGFDKIGAGVTREAVYVGPRSKRVVVETYSIWDNGNGQCVGTRYHLVDDTDELANLAGEYDEVAKALESAAILTPEPL